MNDDREDNFRIGDDYRESRRTPSRTRLPLYLALAFLLGIVVARDFMPAKKTSFMTSRNDKFNEVYQYVEHFYIDTVNKEQLMAAAINGMLQSLDPHSTYANATENKAMQESLDGAFEGIGVQFNIMNDTVTVVGVISGGPSEKVGIRTGDKIVTVDGENFAGVGVDNAGVMAKLKGKKNSKVTVGIKRAGFEQIYEYKITRGVIPTYTVDVSYMIDARNGYIKINQFGSATPAEFSKAIAKLNKQGMERMILDLRGNPGGYLEAAIKVCDELLPAGEMIVYTEGLHVDMEKIFATKEGRFENGEVVVLIDEFSASASEIVAGAVQDNDRGWVVGRRSFGKGLVQRQFDLSDRSTIRLTISRYHTPSGRSIQKDYQIGNTAYAEDIIHRYENGEMDSASNIKFDESLQYKTKNGRVVYGGGGIMPDHFVPLDRHHSLDDFYQVLNSSVLTEYALEYAAKNQDLLKEKYPTANLYVQKMKVDETMYRQLLHAYHLKFPGKEIEPENSSKQELKLWLKALIGRNIYQEEAFYPVINQTDKVILKALEVE